MRLRITDPAHDDIVAMYKYGVETYGERRARTYLAELYDEFRFILEWPLISREHTDIRPPVRQRIYLVHNIIYDLPPGEGANPSCPASQRRLEKPPL